jgi:hypothetical protein
VRARLGRTVSTDGELYERDPEAWNAYLAEANAWHGTCRTVIVDPGAVSAGR